MFRIAIVDHSFVQGTYRKRWRFLAANHPVHVTLLVPQYWELSSAGAKERFHIDYVNENNFKVIPLPTTSNKNWMTYLFKSLDAKIREIDPDLIHTQHSEMTLVNHQLLLYRRLWAPNAKMTFFTMNAMGVPTEKIHQRLRWQHLKSGAEAALAHYPGCKKSLREAGFKKPVYLQTSYGVDETLFYPDESKRQTVRESLGCEDQFVIGYVGRLTSDKGVDDLLKTLPLDDINWSLLLVGDGEMRENIQRRIKRNSWENRFKMTGYIPQKEVPKYMRAMDCFVLGSKTRDDWIDTFPRSIVQAMACETPVIGSDSGAIPFQVGDAGLIYPEGDVVELKNRIRRLANNKRLREKLAKKGRKESVGRFGQRSLAENFYKIMKQVQTGEFEYNHGDEHVQYKAY